MCGISARESRSRPFDRLRTDLRAIPVLITVCLLNLPVYAKYSGGTGEPNDPYQIATAADPPSARRRRTTTSTSS
jgi:hypothetical protein